MSPSTPALHRWIKTDCGRAKLADLAARARCSCPPAHAWLWFVLIAAIRDWPVAQSGSERQLHPPEAPDGLLWLTSQTTANVASNPTTRRAQVPASASPPSTSPKRATSPANAPNPQNSTVPGRMPIKPML